MSLSLNHVYHPTVSAAFRAILIVCCMSLARPHIIGGSFNTDFDLVDSEFGSQSAFSLFSDSEWWAGHGDTVGGASEQQQPTTDLNVVMQTSHSRDTNVRLPTGLSGRHKRGSSQRRFRAKRAALGDSAAADAGAPSIVGAFGSSTASSAEASSVTSSPAGTGASVSVSAARAGFSSAPSSVASAATEVSVSTTNPFLRLRRDEGSVSTTACSFPANLPVEVQQLNAFLQDSQYIGVIPAQDDHVPLPDDQPQNRACPAATGSWWPRPEVNLRSTCPWVWEEVDNGPDAYPRYIRQAKCMCQSCINANSNVCQEIRHEVFIFRLKKCQNGLAVMEKEVVNVTLGCFCAAPQPNSADTDNPIDDPSQPITE